MENKRIISLIESLKMHTFNVQGFLLGKTLDDCIFRLIIHMFKRTLVLNIYYIYVFFLNKGRFLNG